MIKVSKNLILSWIFEENHTRNDFFVFLLELKLIEAADKMLPSKLEHYSFGKLIKEMFQVNVKFCINVGFD